MDKLLKGINNLSHNELILLKQKIDKRLETNKSQNATDKLKKHLKEKYTKKSIVKLIDSLSINEYTINQMDYRINSHIKITTSLFEFSREYNGDNEGEGDIYIYINNKLLVEEASDNDIILDNEIIDAIKDLNLKTKMTPKDISLLMYDSFEFLVNNYKLRFND